MLVPGGGDEMGIQAQSQLFSSQKRTRVHQPRSECKAAVALQQVRDELKLGSLQKPRVCGAGSVAVAGKTAADLAEIERSFSLVFYF